MLVEYKTLLAAAKLLANIWLIVWLERKTNHFDSSKIDIMPLQILRGIREKIISGVIYTIILDETNGIWNREELFLTLNGSVKVYKQIRSYLIYTRYQTQHSQHFCL